MNIIFLTMAEISDVFRRGIYTDLLRKFRDEGNNVYVVSPRERFIIHSSWLKVFVETYIAKRGAELTNLDGVSVLRVNTLNLQKTNMVEKGIGQVLVESQFKSAIKHHLKDVSFDLILYSTPPITFPLVIRYLKEANPQAKTYLLLKDIFPQNAVDLGFISKSGLKGVLYKFFRKKEKDLYAFSDFIGCMSPANVRYVINHNPEVNPNKVEIAPNSYELIDEDYNNKQNFYEIKNEIREKYRLPTDKPIFIYGGNLGKPQGIPFLIQCLDANAHREDCHFVVVGDGTEFAKLDSWYNKIHPKSVSVYQRLPKEDYDRLVKACDVGLIFLDYRFTIPNYPSRLLPYLMEKKPIIAATDPNCDIGSIAEENNYGIWCSSNDVKAFTQSVDKMLNEDLSQMGESGFKFFLENYKVENTYNAIMKHFN